MSSVICDDARGRDADQRHGSSVRRRMVRQTVRQAGQPVGQESVPPELGQPGIGVRVSVQYTVASTELKNPPSRTGFSAEKSCALSFGTDALSGGCKEQPNSAIWLKERVWPWLVCNRNLHFLFAMIPSGPVEPPARKSHGCMAAKRMSKLVPPQ